MNNEFPSGLWLYVLISAALLLNYAIRRIEAWHKRQEQLSRSGEPTPTVQQAAEATRRVRRSMAGEPAIAVRRGETPMPAPVTHPATDARSLVTGRRNLRRAVIAMTVLGPCRSHQPR